MENGDIYVFDETSPLLESRRSILFHDQRADTLTPSYLIELPQHFSDAPVPPTVLLENRRRSRGPSIINTEIQQEFSEQDQEEPLEYFKTRNLTNYRKSILIKDPNETSEVINADSEFNGMEFEIVEPLQDLEKDVSEPTILRKKNAEHTVNTGDIINQKKNIPVIASNNSIGIPVNNKLKSEKTLKSRNNNDGRTKLSLKKESRQLRKVTDNTLNKIIQKSPFENKNADLSKFETRLKIMLMVIPSDDNANSKRILNNHARNNINKNHQQRDNNMREKDRSKLYSNFNETFASRSDQGNSLISNKRLEETKQLTRHLKVGDLNVSKHLQDRSNKYDNRFKQTGHSSDLNRLPIKFCFVEDQDREQSIKHKRIDPNKRKLDTSATRIKHSCRDKNQESNKQRLGEVNDKFVKPHNFDKGTHATKRYHVQLLNNKKQEKGFSMLVSMDNCDVDMKYQGPVKISNYYSSK